MINHENSLLRGLFLARKTGYFKSVYNAVQNGLIDIDTLGIKMYKCKSEINNNDYLVIIIEFVNKVDASIKYRIIRKFGDCWFISCFLEECEFDKLMNCMYSVDDEFVNMFIRDITNMNESGLSYVLHKIWCIPDFTDINIPKERDYEVREKMQNYGMNIID